MPDKFITIDCSYKECKKPLVVKMSNYKAKKSYGQKNFYHRECMDGVREPITLNKIPPRPRGVVRIDRSEW